MSEREALVVLITAPPELAPELARAIVQARLGACVTQTPIRSTYRWQDAIHEDDEIQLVVKTTRDRFAALEAFVLANHTYEVPEIIAVQAVETGRAYLNWLRAETNPDAQ